MINRRAARVSNSHQTFQPSSNNRTGIAVSYLETWLKRILVADIKPDEIKYPLPPSKKENAFLKNRNDQSRNFRTQQIRTALLEPVEKCYLHLTQLTLQRHFNRHLFFSSID